jgi:hypothetical protein
MTWLAKRQIAQRRSKSFLEMRRAFRTKTRMVVGMMKRRQAVIDPRPPLRVEGNWAQRGLVAVQSGKSKLHGARNSIS